MIKFLLALISTLALCWVAVGFFPGLKGMVLPPFSWLFLLGMVVFGMMGKVVFGK